MSGLKDRLASPGPQPDPARRADGLTAGIVEFQEDGFTPKVVQTPWTQHATNYEEFVQRLKDMGLDLPDGYRVILRKASFDPQAWKRDQPFVPGTEQDTGDGTQRKMPATTQPCWRYTFELVLDDGADDLDLEQLSARIAATNRPRVKRPANVERAAVVVVADPQIGKQDLRGGTEEFIERLGQKFDLVEDWFERLERKGKRAQRGVFADAGDLVEGFSNVGSQPQSNDLSKTRQFRVGRRVIHAGIDVVSRHVDEMVCVTCGSNHCQERVGKDLARDPLDDWGVEAMSAVRDLMRGRPAYEHVDFAFPQEWQETVSVRLVGDQILGLAHGHAVGSPDRFIDWWAGQMGGAMPIADATIVVSGHFHHLRVEQPWEGKWWLQAPPMDNGSGWFARTKGRTSDAGLLVFTVTADGLDFETLEVL